jgi:hypothetical protein
MQLLNFGIGLALVGLSQIATLIDVLQPHAPAPPHTRPPA